MVSTFRYFVELVCNLFLAFSGLSALDCFAEPSVPRALLVVLDLFWWMVLVRPVVGELLDKAFGGGSRW